MLKSAAESRAEEVLNNTCARLLKCVPIHFVMQRTYTNIQDLSCPLSVLVALVQGCQDGRFFRFNNCRKESGYALTQHDEKLLWQVLSMNRWFIGGGDKK